MKAVFVAAALFAWPAAALEFSAELGPSTLLRGGGFEAANASVVRVGLIGGEGSSRVELALEGGLSEARLLESERSLVRGWASLSLRYLRLFAVDSPARPFWGAGLGVGLGGVPEQSSLQFSAHAAAGVRVPLGGRLGGLASCVLAVGGVAPSVTIFVGVFMSLE